MAEYNYSPLFLKSHEETVRTLVSLAKDHRATEVRFDQVADLRAFRILILNLKRSLAMNYPDLAFVHNVIRTCTVRDEDGYWVLRIGPAETINPNKGKLRGAVQQFTEIGPRTQPAMASETIQIPLLTQSNCQSVMLRDFLRAMLPNSSIKEVRIDQIDATPEEMPAVIDWVNDKLKANFDLISKEPLIFRRRTSSSANDALPSREY